MMPLDSVPIMPEETTLAALVARTQMRWPACSEPMSTSELRPVKRATPIPLEQLASGCHAAAGGEVAAVTSLGCTAASHDSTYESKSTKPFHWKRTSVRLVW